MSSVSPPTAALSSLASSSSLNRVASRRARAVARAGAIVRGNGGRRPPSPQAITRSRASAELSCAYTRHSPLSCGAASPSEIRICDARSAAVTPPSTPAEVLAAVTVRSGEAS